MAIIRNYSLTIEGGKDLHGQRYKPCWDNFVGNKQDISRLVRECEYHIKQGIKPIVAVFIPRRKRDD